MCPSLSPALAYRTLRGRFKGDATSFAEYLLGGGETELLQGEGARPEAGEPVRAKDLDSDDTTEQQAALRAIILGRYDLIASAAGPSRPVAWGTGQDAKVPRVRYHGGEVATRNGDKYVVEKVRKVI
jgi:hypothetical protein